MIAIDSFLPDFEFKALQEYCLKTPFQIVEFGGKEFSVLQIPKHIYPYFEKEGYDIIFGFIRNAHKNFDNEERIHADGIIMDKKTDLASVFYINDSKGVTKNGTKFYSHSTHGTHFDFSLGTPEFNKLINEDAKDISKWTELEFVQSFPNRLLTYNANRFHGKWPAKIKRGVRIVLVCFYSKIV
jgi:hypothetical protein